MQFLCLPLHAFFGLTLILTATVQFLLQLHVILQKEIGLLTDFGLFVFQSDLLFTQLPYLLHQIRIFLDQTFIFLLPCGQFILVQLLLHRAILAELIHCLFFLFELVHQPLLVRHHITQDFLVLTVALSLLFPQLSKLRVILLLLSQLNFVLIGCTLEFI
jgi:hypothetical protein